MRFLQALIFVFLIGVSAKANACACCASRGTWLHDNITPNAYQLGELKKLSGKSTVQLYQTEAGSDAIKGMAITDVDYYTAAITWKGNIGVITVSTGDGKSGTLSFKMPASMHSIKMDLNNVPDSSMSDVSLYLEWNFKTAITGGTGIFRNTMIAPAFCTLAFQGRGGMCDEAQNFTHWRFDVSGKKAAYSFFGPVPR